ncbi:MAG: biopolymer transporter ExbD [Pseudomonadota bacterium]
MRFSMRGRTGHDEPEINLIPMIDLFLVIIIFLMQTTTYDRFSELQITLPMGGQQAKEVSQTKGREVYIGIQSTGAYKVDGIHLAAGTSVDSLADVLQKAKEQRTKIVEPLIIVINADAQATHQSVVNVMEAANKAGIANITFATQADTPSSK